MRKTSALVGLLLVLWTAAALAPLRAGEPKSAPQPLQMADILAWKNIRGTALSRDGQWFAYLLAPNEGDSELVVRKTQGTREMRFPVGKGAFGLFTFSPDSKWLVFSIRPSGKKAKEAQPAKVPAAPSKLALLELASGKKTEFEKIRNYSFSGENPDWIALHRAPPESQITATEKWSGSDLILRELATGSELNLGNVSEFAFDKKGERLALVIDAQGQGGNGLLLRDMKTAALAPLDNAKATYKGLNWTEKGEALAVLRGVEDKELKDRRCSIVAFSNFASGPPQKLVYDPAADKTFPAGMLISAAQPARWNHDRTALLFGIHQAVKKDAKEPGKETGKGDPKTIKDDKDGPKPGPGGKKQPRGKPGALPGDGAKDTPDLVIWHWNDERLQSQQQVEAGRDKLFTYQCIYHVKDKKFLRLADDKLRQVILPEKGRWAIGTDDSPYRHTASLNGRRYSDLYSINLDTGERRLDLKKNRWAYSRSPDGSRLLYFDDGHYYVLELAAGKTHNLTKDVGAVFVNTEDDHNLINPPRPALGWSKDSASVLLSDGWDVWNVPAGGGKAINLTVDGRKEGLRYRMRFALDREEKGIDLSRPVYFSVYGEWTKKAGIACIKGGTSGAKRMLWDDADFGGLLKAKDAEVFLYTRETCNDYPDYYATDASLQKGCKLTHANPQQEKFHWSRGSMLVNYTSTKGAKLQAALFLPSNYEPGKRYPTIVYIYEKLSGGLNRYAAPTASGFNRAVYTSKGYAVLMPDITYQVNDPGRSAVWCVLPALEAAIATGVVDRERVGLHGHSWGGYQTAFLITQTDAFKAAVAGAPLTNLVSMYSSIYWNTGSANQPIFESSQGRFTSGYWDNLEAYLRNSPVHHAKNVKTPLLLLHNDKDGAVDWNQGIEYFNTLRRLGKPVVMLQYKGENHGLVKPANQRDYMVRMQEFFDHHLRDRPAPVWLQKGIPHLKLEEHLKERVKAMGK